MVYYQMVDFAAVKAFDRGADLIKTKHLKQLFLNSFNILVGHMKQLLFI